jgi:hypothetical protein
MKYPPISVEKRGGEGGGRHSHTHPFLQLASRQIFEDDVNGFSSTADICFMAGGGHTVEFRCPVQISDCSSLNQLLEFTQRLLGEEEEGNYFFTVRDFQKYKK